MRKYGKALTNIIVAIGIFLLVVFLLPKLLAFFAPFVAGWIIAWMAGPVVRFFEVKIKLKRKAGSAFVIISVIALIVLLIYLLGSVLIREGSGFIQALPDMVESAKADLEEVGEHLNKMYNKLPLNIQQSLDGFENHLKTSAAELIGKISSPTITAVGNFAKYLPTMLIAVIMALLSAYFFVAERDTICEWFRKHTPDTMKERYQMIRRSMVQAVGGYFKAQFKIEFWIYLLLLAGLWILRVRYVVLIALGIAFLDFLPFFGTGTVMIPWALVKIFNGDYKMAVGLLITWGVGQLVRQIIQPKIVGDSIGVEPLPTLILLYLGFRFGGVLGMIIAVPVGLIFFSLYEGGAFCTTVDSFRILIAGINHFRRLTPEDLEMIKPCQDEKPAAGGEGKSSAEKTGEQ